MSKLILFPRTQYNTVYYCVQAFTKMILKAKMKLEDIHVSETGKHFQTISVADEGLGEMGCFPEGLHYL